MIGYVAMVPASTFFPPSLSSFCVLLPNVPFDLWRWRQNNPLIVTWIDYEQIGLIALLCDYVQIFKYHQNRKDQIEKWNQYVDGLPKWSE